MDTLYERQADESAKAYEAFCIYRDLGAARSISKVAEELSKSEQLIKRWSAAYEWVKRCAVWDAEQDRIAREAQTKSILDMRRRHAEIAKKGLEKANAALDAIDPQSMSSADIARLMDVSMRMERLSRGDVDSVVETRDGGQAINPVQFYIPNNHRQDVKEDGADGE